MNKPEVTIIIPVYNEEIHIAETLRKIRDEISKCVETYQILIIDDGSTDQSWQQISKCCRELQGLSAIRLSRNFGKEWALCAGLEHAQSKAIIVMDSDLQHPPALIPDMIRLWKQEKYDIVECVKSHRGKESFQNKWGSRLFYFLLNRLSGYDLRGASDFKLLDEKVVHAWRSMPERNTFFRGMIAWLGFNRVEIEFEVPERVGSGSRWSFIGLVKLAVKAVLSFSSFPLRVVNFVGLLFLVGSIVLGAQTLYRKIVGEAVTGFTTVILLQLIIGSVIMVSLGIIGEYISAIYNETKHRPRYVIGEWIMHHESKDMAHD